MNNITLKYLNTFSAVAVVWPLLDAIRKWTPFNNAGYLLQLLIPGLVLGYLIIHKSLQIDPKILIFVCILFFITFLKAVVESIETMSIIPLIAMVISYSQLVFPLLLLNISRNPSKKNLHFIFNYAEKLGFILLAILSINSLITILQSLLGRNHILSASTGGNIGGQISTNTIIELRAPGLFAFINSNSVYTVIVSFFILSLVTKSKLFNNFKYSVLFLTSIAVVRTVSRTFLFSYLLTIFPLVFRKLYLIWIVPIFIALFYFVSTEELQALIDQTISSNIYRLTDTDGLIGLINRFFLTLIMDAGGSTNSIFLNLGNWLIDDPISFLFGKGLGYSSTLYLNLANVNSSYQFLIVGKDSYLLGESNFPTIFAELGLVGFSIYIIIILLNIYNAYFNLRYINIRKSVIISWLSCIILVYNSTSVYFRPATFLGSILLYTSISVLARIQAKDSRSSAFKIAQKKALHEPLNLNRI